jgi:arginine/lysine/ornithine decarboxylase
MIRLTSLKKSLVKLGSTLSYLASKRNYIKPVADESQRDIPIVRTMKKLSISLSKAESTILALPGHKNSKGVDKEFVELWGEKALDNDFYSLSVMDNFFDPKEELKEALRLATELYKTKATFFSSVEHLLCLQP